MTFYYRIKHIFKYDGFIINVTIINYLKLALNLIYDTYHLNLTSCQQMENLPAICH